ncbi:MAG: TRAM domain-containing protein [Candidatus Omnitrophica bacterium]|nr:TRAM domain-containing protein [Candidatus Omnitrophota bacterium]
MEKIRTEIYSLAFGLKGIGRIDGKVCFVKGALPGEQVVFRVVRDKGRYLEGELLEVLEPSKHRITPECPYYGRCGGCQGQHMDYSEELRYKEEQVDELLKRLAGTDSPALLKIEPSSKEYGYRSTVTLHRRGGRTGFFGADGKTLVPVEKCLLAEDALNKEIPGLDPRGQRSDVTIKADAAGRTWSSERMGERFFTDTFRGFEMFFSPRSFSQANRYIAVRILEELEEWMGETDRDTAFFDPYCGSGFFTFLLDRDLGLRVGMDENRAAIDCAKTTLKKHGLKGVKFYRADAEDKFFRIFERCSLGKNILLLDPPRRGVRKDLLEKIRNSEELDRVYYLACDPARLARDVRILTEDGVWRLGRVKPFDMFPRTKHIEVLAELTRG